MSSRSRAGSGGLTSRSSSVTARSTARESALRSSRVPATARSTQQSTARSSGVCVCVNALWTVRPFVVGICALACLSEAAVAVNRVPAHVCCMVVLVLSLSASDAMLTSRSTLSDYGLTVDLSKGMANLDGLSEAQLKQVRRKMQEAYDQLVAKERKYKRQYSARSTARSDVTYVCFPHPFTMTDARASSLYYIGQELREVLSCLVANHVIMYGMIECGCTPVVLLHYCVYLFCTGRCTHNYPIFSFQVGLLPRFRLRP